MKLRRAAALIGAMILTFGVVGAVNADSGNPAHIQAAVNGNTVTVSGDWAWDKCTGKKIIGWAVAWGDPGWTSNPVPKAEGGGSYYMGDATQGNTVFTSGDPCTGTSGPLYPATLSHTYDGPGTYDVCVIVYDIVKDNDGGYPTGKHGVLAGGPNRNTDNSVEENELKGTSICMSPEIPVVVTNPRISLTKSADPDALPYGGGDVTYTYAVKNVGDVTLTGIEVWDDNGTTGDKTDDWKVDCPKATLAVDEAMTCTEKVDVDETTTNIGTATGHAGDKDTLDADDATVTVAPAPNPRIYIAKKASVETLYGSGGEVTYTYVVTNIGNVPLSDVTVTDNKCSAVSDPIGDTNDNEKLDVDETWTYTCTMTLAETTTNVGTATGHYGDETTIDAAEKTVTVTSRVNHPQIYLLKTASVAELPAAGGPVTYTYLVWNVGNAPLTDVTVVDDKCSAVTGPTGDTGADKILGLDETWTYTCTMTLTATTTNTGTATGHAGDYESVDAAQATVTVLGGGGVAGETSVTTAPPTDTVVTTTTGPGGSLPLLLLILGIIGTGAVVLTPRRVKR